MSVSGVGGEHVDGILPGVKVLGARRPNCNKMQMSQGNAEFFPVVLG